MTEFTRPYQKGNIFAMMFAAVAMVGVLGVVGMQTVSGPITTITKVTQKNITDTDIMTNGRIVILNAATLNAAADGDDTIEPAPMNAACAGTPIDGGCLPTDIGAVLSDPWGTNYGYCVWNHGSVNTGVAGYLDGETDNDRYVVAIISAGRNKVFETTCVDYDGAGAGGLTPEVVGGMRVGTTDDVAKAFTYAEAEAGAGGLWDLVSGNVGQLDASVDTLQIGSNATFDVTTGIGDFMGLTVDDIIAKTDEFMSLEGALLLDNAGTTTADTCGAPQEGALRLNAALDTLQICNGTAFVDITSDAWRIIDTSWGSNTYVSVAGVNNSANTDTIDFVTSGSSRMTVSPTGLVSVVGNALVGGNASIEGSATVLGSTTLGDATGDLTTVFEDLTVGRNTTIGQDLAVNGNVLATSYLHSSDRRLKDDIKDIDDPFALLDAIHGKHYEWKKDGKGAYGVIAQDVETVMPDAVATDKSTDMKSVEYDQLIAPIIEALKDLRDMIVKILDDIAAIFNRIDALETENAALKAELETVKSQNADIIKRLEAIEKKD